MGTRKNRHSEAVLTSTHNLCFGAKIRKNVYPCKPQFYYIKVGCKGVFVTRTCFRDVFVNLVKITILFILTNFIQLETIETSRKQIRVMKTPLHPTFIYM